MLRRTAAAVGIATLVACGADKPRSADALLAAAANALRASRSYHVTGMLDPGLTVDVVVVPGGSSGTITSHGVTFDEVAQHGSLWLHGKALWDATVPADEAARLGDQWVLVQSPEAAFGLTSLLQHLDESIPGLVFAPQPKLVDRGTKTLDQQRVVEIANDKDTYDIRAEGTPYPVRWLDVDTPGANGDPCGITLGDFDAPATITPPATWLQMS